MPPAAGLRPNPTPLRDQGKGTRGGDLLPARHEGSQTGHQGARRKDVPCPLASGPTGTSPRREEITTQPGAREEGHLASPRRIPAQIRDQPSRGSRNAQPRSGVEPSPSFPLKGSHHRAPRTMRGRVGGVYGISAGRSRLTQPPSFRSRLSVRSAGWRSSSTICT
jgi:hypothetical protein